jgi:hypothetical protein
MRDSLTEMESAMTIDRAKKMEFSCMTDDAGKLFVLYDEEGDIWASGIPRKMKDVIVRAMLDKGLTYSDKDLLMRKPGSDEALKITGEPVVWLD